VGLMAKMAMLRSCAVVVPSAKVGAGPACRRHVLWLLSRRLVRRSLGGAGSLGEGGSRRRSARASRALVVSPYSTDSNESRNPIHRRSKNRYIYGQTRLDQVNWVWNR